jgi:hypothetical protein
MNRRKDDGDDDGPEDGSVERPQNPRKGDGDGEQQQPENLVVNPSHGRLVRLVCNSAAPGNEPRRGLFTAL